MFASTLIETAATRFAEAGIDSATVDAELLIAHALKMSRNELLTKLVVADFEIADDDLQAIEKLIARRESREPLQHLTGIGYFRHLELKVGPGVFVPRPETEHVAGLAIEQIKNLHSDAPLVVDLCAGSGAIGLAVATELPHTKVFGVEKSEDAIEYTRSNYAKLAPHNAQIILGDIDGCLPNLDGTVDYVIANPPYIPAAMVPIYPEVALHDPALALYSGEDGLDLMRVVSRTALRLLRSGGGLTVEHADTQGEQVRQLLLDDGWSAVATFQDFNMRDRATMATKR